jgi:hypothetical protein
MCFNTGEKERGGKEKWDGDQRLFMPTRRRGRIGKGQGVRGSVPRGGEMGKGEGAPGTAWDSSGSRHWPSADGCGRRRCRATGEGGGARATRA